MFLLLEDSAGNVGVGEGWCNFPTCGAEHRAQLLNSAILPALLGREFSDPAACYAELQQQFQRLAIQSGEPGPIAQSLAAVDIALWDLVARRLHLPLYKLFGGSHANIKAYASGINPTGATETFLCARQAGYTAFKLKIGFGDAIDYTNIESIAAQLRPNEQLMVDANQAWTLEEAMVQAERLADYMCKWGGFSGVLPVAREALRKGKTYCPHFLGGGVGLAASAHLLAAVGGCGMLEVDFNPNPLREDLYSPAIENGRMIVSVEPGVGIDFDKMLAMQNSPLLSCGL